MLIDRYDLKVTTPLCEPGAERFAVTAHLDADIAEVLPYLNATLRGAVYHQAAGALIWKKAGHAVAFHSHSIAASNVQDREAAEQEVKGLIALVNRTWKRRGEITPDFALRLRPVPLNVFRLLPQTNCKACGEPTCFTFALKLVAGQRALVECAPIHEARYAEQLRQLDAMMIDAPAIG